MPKSSYSVSLCNKLTMLFLSFLSYHNFLVSSGHIDRTSQAFNLTHDLCKSSHEKKLKFKMYAIKEELKVKYWLSLSYERSKNYHNGVIIKESDYK